MEELGGKLEKLKTTLQDSGAGQKEIQTVERLASRRAFLGGSMFAGISATLLESADVWKNVFGRGLVPELWAKEDDRAFPGKAGMNIHNLRPVNGEFPPWMLDDDVTPNNRHFVRNNGLIPPKAKAMDSTGWTLTIEGLVDKTVRFTLDELKKLPSKTGAYLIECGGNGRALFDPPVRGNQWERGAVSCSEWKGVPLKDLLEKAGLKSGAVYTAHYGEDIPLGKAPPFSRGIPIEKALNEHTIVAYEMNGRPIPPEHGFPVRLVVPGWIGSCSQKWLNRIVILDKVHDSKKMSGYSYRVPSYQVAPGVKPPKAHMEIATEWRIKSMITGPKEGAQIKPGESVQVSGHAWAGEKDVDRVMLSIDFGLNWEEAKLKDPPNSYAWYRFEQKLKFPKKGYYEIWARACDDNDEGQPFRQPWNPKGYLGNVIHRLPIYVGISSDA